MQDQRHIAVVGAGAFGGWTALYLLRKGQRVTLLDAWGPGNTRSSSGDESRIIRAVYGGNTLHSAWSIRALQLWKEHETRWNRRLFHRTGVLWLVAGEDRYVAPSLPFLGESGIEFAEYTPEEAMRLYPQMNLHGVRRVLLEMDAGYIAARDACNAVHQAFTEEGGTYVQSEARPGTISENSLHELRLSNGTRLRADGYVFAAGAWLPRLFDHVPLPVRPTRQEVFYFGTPAGDSRFEEQSLPVWILLGERLIYGIPGNGFRGMKVGDDTRGPEIDPTSADRVPTPANLSRARETLEYRFPAMKNAPLLEARVCQYENTPDLGFLIDRLPDAANAWIVGGGSGHGFKHGPVVGEYAATLVAEDRDAEPHFRMSRFA